MDSKEKRPVLDVIKVEAIQTRSKVERSKKGPFVREQCPVNILDGLRIFYPVVR
jgi:hypothetical protein